jgi:hypothetical protein
MLTTRTEQTAITDAADVQNNLLEIPNEFLCPIQLEIMRDPVIVADGFTYERVAIEEWLRGHRTSPKTGLQLPHTTLIPNHTLRQSIESVMKKMTIIQRRDIEQRQQELDLKKIMELREMDLQVLEEKFAKAMGRIERMNTCLPRVTFFGANDGIPRELALKILDQVSPNPSSVTELRQYLQLTCVSKSWHTLFNDGRLIAKRKAVKKQLLDILNAGDLEKANGLIRPPGIEINSMMLINSLRSMNLELIKHVYEKLGSDPEIMRQCVHKLPHVPRVPYKQGQPQNLENTVFYCRWATLSDILADENNFEARVYASDWLWKQNGSNPNWIMSITKASEHIRVINRKGEVVEELAGDNSCGPSALKYRLPFYATNCYIKQINCAAEACYDCYVYIDEQQKACVASGVNEKS